MKKLMWPFAALLFLAIPLHSQSDKAWRSKVSPDILIALDKGEKPDLIVVFREQADLSAARRIHGKAEKARFVYQSLESLAERAQARATRIVRERQASANRLLLVNAMSVEHADAALTRALAELGEVKWLGADPWVRYPGPFKAEEHMSAERNTVEWGIAKINAPDVWALGYTGQGVTVGGSDTGYEWWHPALRNSYRGWTGDSATTSHTYNWHDAIHELNPLNGDTTANPFNNPCGLDSPVPCDDSKHGTHTMGTMTGDDGMGNQIGVAPGAKWIGCRNMERNWGKPSSYLECFGWFLAPTDLNGENPDPSKSPDVINNSWYCATFEGCNDLSIDSLLLTAVINMKAAGIVVVVSNGNAGNNGTCGTTNDPPAFFRESFSVGAIESNDTVAGYSSRGPVMIDGSLRTKPNVVAPGSFVRSSVPNGGYEHFWGTSMAGPHVVGLVALMLSAKPELTGEVETIEDMIEQTAVYFADTTDCPPTLGTDRPNHAYGWGRVDALAAVNAAIAWSPVSVAEPLALTAAVFPNPARGQAVFDLKNITGPVTLELFAADGKRVFSKNWTAAAHELVPVSLKHLPQGVYFWRLRAINGVASGKLEIGS
ncbi:MAG: S8 family peptidase [Saprospiraceae bacterium]